jgi:hypothetical protein
MEQTSKNIQTLAFFFFSACGTVYLISSLLVSTGNFLPTSQTLKNALLLPTIIMGLAYAASCILENLALEGKNSRIQVLMAIAVTGFLTVMITIIHFGFSKI